MFKSVGHFFTAVAKTVVGAARIVGKNAAVVGADAVKAAPIVEAVTAVIYPPAEKLEETAFQLLGNACHVVSEADTAVSGAGLNLALDAQTVADLKALIPQLEQFAKAIGAQKPAPVVAQAAAAS